MDFMRFRSKRIDVWGSASMSIKYAHAEIQMEVELPHKSQSANRKLCVKYSKDKNFM